MFDYRQMAAEIARRYNIPVDLFLAQINQESRFNPAAVSDAGAIGLGQIMPGTAKELGIDPTDPMQNLEGSARYLSQQYNRFGDWGTALAAYNAGPGAVSKYGGIPPYKETQNYVRTILGNVGKGTEVAADTMAALGKGGGAVTPNQIAQAAQAQSTGMQQDQQPKGFLGGLLSNPDMLANLAIAFNSMRLNPDPAIATLLSGQMKERRAERETKRQRNATASWLRSNNLESLAQAVESGALTGAQALSMAKSGRDEGTAAMQNYARYQEILKTEGKEAADRFWQMTGGKGMQPQFGTIPAGYELVQDSQTGGYRMQPIKGGPADVQAQQAEAAAGQRASGQRKYGQVVLENVDAIREKIKTSTLPVAGLGGALLKNVPGTDAYDVSAMADTIRANIGFERLNEMRKESPTGGALGQVTERELAFLQNSLANLEQSQSQAQFERNLDIVEREYKAIMDKFSAYPNAEKYGFSGQQPASRSQATHRYNPATGQVEEIR